MTITIEYCTVWNYEPRAVRVAAEIRGKFPDADITMIPSGGGRFEVTANGTPIFQKSKLGRHAEPGEVVRLLETRARP